MKKTIRSLLVSLPLIIAAAPSFAGFQMRIPMEVAGGGSMPNGSITFNNNAETAPETVEPTEPEVVDPFAPENPACDPYAQGYPGNSTGKDYVYGYWYQYPDTGVEYRSCKLKPVSKPKLLARYSSIIPSPRDDCNPSRIKTYNLFGANVCYAIGFGMLEFFFKPTEISPGVYSYANHVGQINIGSDWGFTMSDVDRIEFGGFSCNNLRYYKRGPSVTKDVICDSNASYEGLLGIMDKQLIVEIYAK